MSWEQIEDAFVQAIALAARIPPTLVLWAYQDIDQPPMDNSITGDQGNPGYVKLALPSIKTLGIDFLTQTFDATRVGQELELQPQGQREVPLEVQVFSAKTVGGTAAKYVAEQIRTHLLLPSVRNILTAVGISPFDPGPVNDVPSVVAAGFRGRATCTIRCYMPTQALAEYVGYIATINGTVTSSGGKSPTPNVLPYTGKVDS